MGGPGNHNDIEPIIEEPQRLQSDPIEKDNCGQQVVVEDAVLEQMAEGRDEDIQMERSFGQ